MPRPIGCQHGEDPSGHDRECECPDAEELTAWLDAQEDEES